MAINSRTGSLRYMNNHVRLVILPLLVLANARVVGCVGRKMVPFEKCSAVKCRTTRPNPSRRDLHFGTRAPYSSRFRLCDYDVYWHLTASGGRRRVIAR
jgi:hypothetical protein